MTLGSSSLTFEMTQVSILAWVSFLLFTEELTTKMVPNWFGCLYEVLGKRLANSQQAVSRSYLLQVILLSDFPVLSPFTSASSLPSFSPSIPPYFLLLLLLASICMYMPESIKDCKRPTLYFTIQSKSNFMKNFLRTPTRMLGKNCYLKI